MFCARLRHDLRPDLGGAGEPDLVTRGSVTRALADGGARARAGREIASGRPASTRMSASAQHGERRVGWPASRRSVFPQARAGAIFHDAITSGKFHGVMSAQTPTGSRSVTSMPGSWIGDRLAEDLVRRAAPVLEDVGDQADLAAGVADRLAAVAGLERGELLEALAHQDGGPEQHPAALRGRRPRPPTLLSR